MRSRTSKPVSESGTTNDGGTPPEGAAATPDRELTAAATLPKPPVVNSRETSNDRVFAAMLPYSGQVPPLPAGYSAIVNSVFNLPDPKSIYEEVLAGIKPIKASRASMSELLDALDDAQAVALKARGLLVNTKVTFDAVERESAVLKSAMRDQALSQLEREKDAGTRKKAITEADVTGAVATMFPDEWKSCQEQESKARRSVDLIENMCERAVERARDLRAIVGASRSV
jgi:hypothetical protein